MKRPVVQWPASRVDLVDIYDVLEASSPRAADRFLGAVQRTFDRLASQPGSGTLVGYGDPALVDLRVCMVDRFRSYLIFYIARDDRIEVVRILHGKRGDLEDLLGRTLEPA